MTTNPQQPASPALSSTAQALDKKMDASDPIQKLISQVTKRTDAAALLAQLAEKLGGDKIEADKALKAALAIVTKNEQAVQAESHHRTVAFVSYLFS
jgi:hypothetical protein